jgi:predicted RNA-binding Zn ribbon-like protein
MTNEKNGNFYFVGHHLCLDFMNTLVADGGQLVELLPTFADFVAWASAATLVTAQEAQWIVAQWSGQPEAAVVLQQALQFRATIQTMLKTNLSGQATPAVVVDAINIWLGQQSGYTEVIRVGEQFTKRYHTTIHTPRQLLAPIAHSAADLLCYADWALVRKCENPACVLYFYDTSKNHSRRWCSMSLCGNRAKAAAHYLRKKRAPNAT